MGYQFARATLTKGHKPGSLNNRNVLSHTLEARSPRSQCRQGGFLLGAVREICSMLLSSSGGWRIWKARERSLPRTVGSH